MTPRVAIGLASAAPTSAGQLWVSLLLVEAVVVVLAIRAVYVARQMWRRADLPLSWRLDAVLSAIAAGTFCSIGTSMVVFIAAGRPVPGAAVVGPLLLGVSAAGVLQLLVLKARRQEQHDEDLALRRKGLPVRRRLMSWKATAVICGLGWPIAFLSTTAALAPLLPQEGLAAWATICWVLLGLAIWLLASPVVIFRQWRRQKAGDKAYWLAYREANLKRDASPE